MQINHMPLEKKKQRNPFLFKVFIDVCVLTGEISFDFLCSRWVSELKVNENFPSEDPNSRKKTCKF